MMHTITLKLSEPLYRFALQVATAIEQPLETVLQDSLTHTLLPFDNVAPAEAAELAKLASLNDATLWQEARATLSAGTQAKMHELLDRQGAGTLTANQHARLQDLLDMYGWLTVYKAHAYLLLARRGYRVPMQEHVQ